MAGKFGARSISSMSSSVLAALVSGMEAQFGKVLSEIPPRLPAVSGPSCGTRARVAPL